MSDTMHEKILEILQNTPYPLALSEIIQRLNVSISDRTLRRVLDQLVQENKIKKTGSKRGTRYASISNPTQPYSSYFSTEALFALNYIRQPLFKRDPVIYQKSFLDDYVSNETQYLSDELKNKLMQAGNRDNHHPPSCTYIKQIYHRFLIDLSYNSSRLEGNTYSLLDTQRLVMQGESAEGKLTEETIMILNHKEAIRYLIDNIEKLQLIPDEIFTLHYLLSDGLVANKYAGKIRDTGVRISASVYIPIENEATLSLLLSEILTKAQAIKHPFEQSLFLLAHIAYLQPFIDVNKRTARLIANYPLIKHNLVPLSFNDVNKDDYIAAMLSVYERQNLTPLIELYSHSYLRTCKLYDATMESVVNFDALRVRYRSLRRSIIRDIIIQKLTGDAITQKIDRSIEGIPLEHHNKCKADILEDLHEITPYRIAGLGISKQQLQEWMILNRIE